MQDIDEFDHHGSIVAEDTRKEFREFAEVLMAELGLVTPTTAREALNLYILLVEKMEQIL